jgi:hypothetical protein
LHRLCDERSVRKSQRFFHGGRIDGSHQRGIILA